MPLPNNSLALGEELGLAEEQADDAGGAAWDFKLILGWLLGGQGGCPAFPPCVEHEVSECSAGVSCQWELFSS